MFLPRRNRSLPPSNQLKTHSCCFPILCSPKPFSVCTRGCMHHYSEVHGEYCYLLGQCVPGLRRHSCNKLIFFSRKSHFSCGVHLYMESSNQHVVLLFIRIMPLVWCLLDLVALPNSLQYMDNIQLTNKVLTENENQQGQSVLKGVMHFVSVQGFYSEFIKGQKFFNCMYQVLFELQNNKARASLEDLIFLMAHWSNVLSVSPWVGFQLISSENSFWFSCSTCDILVLSNDEIVFSYDFEEHSL